MGLVHVEFDWDDKYGECYECSSPAAYTIQNMWSLEYPWEVCEQLMQKEGRHCERPDEHMKPELTPEGLRCAVCAANAAANGETITWLWKKDFDSDEHAF